jgi:hypothetical protein
MVVVFAMMDITSFLEDVHHALALTLEVSHVHIILPVDQHPLTQLNLHQIAAMKL